MTLSAPIQFDQYDERDHDARRDRAPEVPPATATAPAVAAAEPQTQAQTQGQTAAQPAMASSWGGIVLATLALWGCLGLWTLIAVRGDYVRWLVSVAVLAAIVAMSMVALKHVVADK